jgi:hypothetical protein
MEALRVEILNPKVMDILDRLADLRLISISKEDESLTNLRELLKQLRSKSSNVPDLEEIQKEVQQIRAKRYAKKSAQDHS